MLDKNESLSPAEAQDLFDKYSSLNLTSDVDESTVADFVSRATVCISKMSPEERQLLGMLRIDVIQPENVLITLAHCYPTFEYRKATDGKEYSLYTFAVSILLTALKNLVESSTLCNDQLDTQRFLKASGDIRDVLQARLIR